jgi:dTDP-4-amino-4,6-dideoxygalactose transaminase
MKVPFNKAYQTGKELTYIQDALHRSHISGDGHYTKLVHKFIESKFGANKALLTTSCTHALEMAAILINLGPGDEVILPSYTFVSTVNAIILRGATPVFADVDPHTLNIDPRAIAAKVTEHTRAIFVVHYAGVSCDMDEIMELAKQHDLFVVEDAAQGVNAKYKNKFLGTIGHIGCYSFHETKNYSCGEGGAIVINSLNKELIERAEIIREKGTNRSKFFRGQVDKYTWVDVGSSYLPSDLLAAFLHAQFEKLDEINLMRKRIYERYHDNLMEYEDAGRLKLPVIPPERESNYHMFYLILPDEAQRDQLIYKLKEKDIGSVFHYIPLHTSPMGEKMGYQVGDLPVTERLSSRLVRLPMYAGMTNEEQDYVIENIKLALKELDYGVVSVNSNTGR